MRHALRATALLSASSFGGILIAAVYAKARALMIGPEGLGVMVLLQNLVTLATTVFGLGLGAAIIQRLAGAQAAQDDREASLLRLSAWTLRIGAALAAAVLFAACSRPLARLVLGTQADATAVAVLGIAAAFALATDLHVSTLVAHQRIACVARATVLAALVGAAGGTARLAIGGPGAVTAALVAYGAGGWLATIAVSHGQIPRLPIVWPERSKLAARLRQLLRFGVPYAGSQVVGGGVLLVLPFAVLIALGSSSVAFYQAALAIGATYPAGLINALGSDYYQRLSAAHQGPDRSVLSSLVSDQLRLVLAVGTPLALLLMGLAPYLVPLAYSRAFLPAVGLLQWMVLGDVFKFASYTMSFAILAGRRSGVFLVTELVGGGVYLASAWVGMHALGLSGLGVSWLVTYAIYLVVVSALSIRSLKITIAPANVLLLAASFFVLCCGKLASGADRTAIRLCVPLTLAALTCLGAVWLVRKGLVRA